MHEGAETFHRQHARLSSFVELEGHEEKEGVDAITSIIYCRGKYYPAQGNFRMGVCQAQIHRHLVVVKKVGNE